MIVVRFPTATHFRVRALEWLLAGVLLTWGVILAQPYHTLTEAQYSPLLNLAPESVWTFGCFAVAISRLMALYVNGAWVPSPWVRLLTALISAVFWLQVVLSLATTGTVTTGLAVYPWFLLCDLYSVGRAAQDARLSREARMARPEAPMILPPSA